MDDETVEAKVEDVETVDVEALSMKAAGVEDLVCGSSA